MPANLPRLGRTIVLIALGGIASLMPATRIAAGDTPVEKMPADQTAADFLDVVGLHTKVRWRLMFRPPPPTPPTDRNRAALILGSLLGDSFLVLQATDAQQFRNNNQDVLAYCRTLGLGEKLLPRLMTQGNLAEQNAWKELRQELVDGHQQVLRLLREQMDEDLSLLIDIGLDLRLLEIVAGIIVAAPEGDVLPLCSSTPALLQQLHDDIGHVSAGRRDLPLMLRVRATIEEAGAMWREADKKPLTQAQAVKTIEMIKTLMEELTGR